MEMLSPDTPVEKLPVLPRLHDGRFDRLSLAREVNGQQWVLRLWPTEVKTLNDTFLFVGTIEVQTKGHLAGLITLTRGTDEYDRPLVALKPMLHERFAMKSVSRTNDKLQVDHENRRLHWGGRVLLVRERVE
jgi:hypothetical protein